ncbi:DUF305 domain-containing protein [Marixanthomonas sp. SCSIO 43207]|uniref:DUF305 domain-containing protein n=1 Tax=Marixanthomonas sp. SCSIO 43207 TaxID=2779360 RepID=UPI001CAA05E0|nr:DUF305 domain-containing protein [Marixanthomonas sp. SCSIO 43207]UAB80036.1 DUF305 domain-containing protein [Marixanthomonas sp. SCSIO 43207]
MASTPNKTKKYIIFFAMVGTSIVVMFFLMYLHSYQILDHFWFSETRLFMALLMGGAMVIIMLLYMLPMYQDRLLNGTILALGILMMITSLWLVRSQVTVSGTDYMEGMIPHHSIAILTSERSQIKDLRVQELAAKISKAQRKEIKEMQWLLNDIKKNGAVVTEKEKEQRPVPKFNGTPNKKVHK